MSGSKTILLPEKIFTGDQWLTGHAVIVEGKKVEQIISAKDIDENASKVELKNMILSPAFIDLQIYGANKKLFAAYPTVAALQDLYAYCYEGGAALFQPTVATNTLEVFYRCIDAARQYREQGGAGMIGLHLEGPWINSEKRGAHRLEWVHSPTIKDAEELLQYGEGIITMITLAPEVCSPEVIQLIQSHHITISAGHSNATYQEATTAFDQGVPAVTHLYNAMSSLQHRAPGLVGAAFLHPQVKASIIPDGYHVDYEAIRIAKELMKDRLFVITDAVTESAKGYYQHQKEGNKYVNEGILSGSALTMHQAFVNLVQHVKIPVEEALRMCSLYPAQVIGLDQQYGRIAPGYTAEFIVLNASNYELQNYELQRMNDESIQNI